MYGIGPLGADFVETWKRTNFGIPNKIKAVRFPTATVLGHRPPLAGEAKWRRVTCDHPGTRGREEAARKTWLFAKTPSPPRDAAWCLCASMTPERRRGPPRYLRSAKKSSSSLNSFRLME